MRDIKDEIRESVIGGKGFGSESRRRRDNFGGGVGMGGVGMSAILLVLGACGGGGSSGGGGGNITPDPDPTPTPQKTLSFDSGAKEEVSLSEGMSDVDRFSAELKNGEGSISYSLEGADAGLFGIDSQGRLTFLQTPDYETKADSDKDGIYDLTVVARGGSLTARHNVKVTVDNVLPEFDESLSETSSVDEYNKKVGDFVAREPGGVVKYGLQGADAGLFEIDAYTGALSFVENPDKEDPKDSDGDGEYELTITATSGDDTTEYMLKVGVMDVETKFGEGLTTSLNVREGDTLVGDFTATGGYGLMYSLGGVDAGLFEISDDGMLSFKSAPDFESPAGGSGDDSNTYKVTIFASSAGEFVKNPLELSVTVTDVALMFEDGASSSVSVEEGLTVVGVVKASEPSGVMYSVTGGADQGLFMIDANTGAVSFTSAPDFGAPAGGAMDDSNTYEVIITATSGSETETHTLTVMVTNVDETVLYFGGLSSEVEVAENMQSVGTFVAMDPDVGDTVTYGLGGVDAGLFAISADGMLSFKTSPDYESPMDGDGDNVYEVTIEAMSGTGGGAQTASHTLRVSVTNVDETSVMFEAGVSGKVLVQENVPEVGNFAATDSEGGVVTYELTGSDAGLFVISADGMLSFKSAPDFEAPGDADADNMYEVSVTAKVGSESVMHDVVVEVGDVGPRFASDVPSEIVVKEGENFSTLFSATGSGDLVYSVEGVDGKYFDIGGLTGALSFRGIPDYESFGSKDGDNTYELTVVAMVLGGESSRHKVVVKVEDVGPKFGEGVLSDVGVRENTDLVGVFAASDPGGGSVVYSLGGDDAGLFRIDERGTLRFKSAPDFETPGDADKDNTYDVTVIATSGSESSHHTLEVKVGDEGPKFGQGLSSSITVKEGENFAKDYSAKVESGVVLYSLEGADSEFFKIDSRGVLTLRDGGLAHGAGSNVYAVTVVAESGGDRDTIGLTVTVEALGDRGANVAPTFDGTPLSRVEVAEGMETVGTFAASDSDAGDMVTYGLKGADAHLFMIGADGMLSLVKGLDYEAPVDADGDNEYEVTITAGDGHKGITV
jgi:hypothetical protein